jgi:hypothetical protein
MTVSARRTTSHKKSKKIQKTAANGQQQRQRPRQHPLRPKELNTNAPPPLIVSACASEQPTKRAIGSEHCCFTQASMWTGVRRGAANLVRLCADVSSSAMLPAAADMTTHTQRATTE